MHFYRRLYTFILSRRYKIKIEGLDILKSPKAKLILPNHVSHIDPQLMTLVIYKYTDFVPLVAERFFNIPVIRFFLRRLHAVKVYEANNIRKDPELLDTINSAVFEALKNRKSALIFPSGQLSEGGLEHIRNKQSAYSIVSNLPDEAMVVGVRIRGLWGSMWSKAWNGERPPFFRTYLVSILLLFVNLVFLCPKRRVNLEFVDITQDARRNAGTDRRTFNFFLESFYNQQGPEKAIFVRHLFFFPGIRNKVREGR